MGLIPGFIADAANAVGGFVKEVTGLIDTVSTTEEEKLEKRNQLAELAGAFQIRLGQMFAEAHAEQAATVRAEITGASWLQRNWRPILALTFGGVVVYATIAPALGAPAVDMSGVPDRMWSLLTVMVGGYTVLRSAEKIIPASKWAK